MLVFNGPGIIGMVGSAVLVWLLEAFIGPLLHLPADWGIVFTLEAVTFLMALFGLTFDRCEEPTLLQGYQLNMTNFFMPMSRQLDNGKGVFYRPDRLLCFCGIPLVTAPLIFQLLVILFWIYAATGVGAEAQSKDYPLYVVSGAVLIGLCWGYATLTKKWRNLPNAQFILPPTK